MNLLELTIAQGGILQSFVNLMGDILNIIFRCLHHVGIENAALCIIIFTIFIKALMIPLNIKQQKFSKLSSKMQPEMQAIQKKYQGKKDQDSMRKQSMEMNDLYAKYGVSPTGGCLPLLITFPVLLALYRVIYNIPDHIDYIKNLYDNIADAIMNTDGYSEKIAPIAEAVKRATVDGDVNEKKEVLSVLSNLKTEQWNDLKEAFPSISDIITSNSNEIISINSFLFGLNIADWPTTNPWPGLLIPLFAVLVQWYQTKQISSTQQNMDNPTAQSMMMMTKIMPFFSGFICLSLPIGAGLYWIVSGLFTIIQQFFVNRHMDKIDIDDLMEKNKEKARKKKIRMGLDPDASFSEIAQQNNKSISNYARGGNNKDSKSSDGKSNGNNNKTFKKGSISSYANMVSNNYKDKK